MNGSPYGNGVSAIWPSTSYSPLSSPAFEATVSLNNGDVLSLWLENVNGSTITLYSGQFVITAIGAAGPQGINGVTGPTGPANGPTGATGATGPSGAPGYYAELYANTNQAYSPGSDATFNLTNMTDPGVHNGISVNGSTGTMTIQNTGEYLVSWDVDCQVSSGGNSVTMYAVLNNLTALAGSEARFAATGTSQTASMQTVVSLTAGSNVNIQAFVSVGGSDSFTTSAVSFNITAIGSVGPTGPAGAAESTTIVTHSTGPYTVLAQSNAMVDTTTGSISKLTLGTGVLGNTFEVSDYGELCNANNITVGPAAGAQLEDPNNPGVYQAANVTCVFQTPGQFCRWRFDGVSKYKIVSTGT